MGWLAGETIVLIDDRHAVNGRHVGAGRRKRLRKQDVLIERVIYNSLFPVKMRQTVTGSERRLLRRRGADRVLIQDVVELVRVCLSTRYEYVLGDADELHLQLSIDHLNTAAEE